MNWFRRRQRTADTFHTGHEGDDELLAQISQHSNLNIPRHWVHYLYCPGQHAAEQAAHEIHKQGWQIQALEQATLESEWVVVAERTHAVISPEAVQEARAFFEAVASRVRGQYDGWEASV